MLTYSARIESGDSLQYFNAAASIARHGDDLLDLALWFTPPRFDDFSPPYPLRPLTVESLSPALQPILASGLYALADSLQNVGLVHTVWLFNILVNALAAGVFYLYALALGYNLRTALAGALLLAFCTISWPYSKTFFRDPLAALLILLAAYCLERWRQRSYRAWRWLLLAGLFMLGGLHTKTTAAMALPALLVVVLPALRRWGRPGLRRVLNGLFLLLLMFPPLLIYGIFPLFLAISDTPRLLIFNRFAIIVPTAQTALHTYLFSIGGSVWGTSPIVLLAIPGGWILLKGQRHRYTWTAALILLTYSLGYALFVNEQWFGGLSWPPRFLLPVIPFLMLAGLPAIDMAVMGKVARWALAAFGVLAAYSLWVQISAVSLEWGRYPEALPPEAGRLVEWGPGLNVIQYLRWVIVPGLWSRYPLDFAWVRTGAAGWALLMAAFSLLCVWALWIVSRARRWLWIMGLLPISFALLVCFGLRAFYVDGVYQGDRESLHQMLTLIGEVTQPGDYVVLNSNEYERFFLNYARARDRRFITLPAQPGERPSLEQAPRIVSHNPDDLLFNYTIPALHQLAAQQSRLWFLMDSGPFIPWSVRPVERFMNAHYFPLREYQTDPPDPRLRLIAYDTTNAPDRFAFRGPSHLSTLEFESTIQLAGFDLPSGDRYLPGDVLPVSLYWRALSPIATDYIVALKLVNQEGFVIAEAPDTQPDGGFAPSSGWTAGVPVWDNRALILPAELEAGQYYLWVVLYERLPDGTIRTLTAAGGQRLAQGEIRVLPVTVRVNMS